MPQQYVKLTDQTLFKSRYEKWYLIDTSQRGRERILIDGGTEQVLLFLFAGNSVDQACESFGLTQEDLIAFLRGLVHDNVIAWNECSISSIVRCHNIEPPLDSVNILLTNACNLRCVHCYLASGKPMIGELTGDEWINTLKEACELGAFELNVSGGEATLHRDFIKVAEHIASIPTFNANLNTNGFLLRPEHEETVAHAFTSVQISIDDAVAIKHDKFRGCKGSFNRSIATIGRLIQRGVETNIGFTLTPGNLDSIDDVLTLAESLGVTTLNIGLVANLGRASENLLIESPDLRSIQSDSFMRKMYRKMKDLAARSSSVRILLPFRASKENHPLGLQEKRFICSGDNTQILYITANGNMMPCDKLPIEKFSYGNVRQNSILDGWGSERMKNFKLKSPRQLPKCGACPHLKICGGACVARGYQSGGSLDSPDWTSCAMAQLLSQDCTA